jgi:CBS domain-containing protein
LKEVAELMKKRNVGSIPIVETTRVVGLVTDRDIVVRSVAMGHDPNEVTAGDIMSRDLAYVFLDQDVAEAAKVMQDKQIRRLPVLDRQMQMVGIVSLGDLAVDTKQDKLSGDTLERISKPSKPD